MLSSGHPCVREASTLPARPRDSLVSVGSFPELVGSDPPGEVEKPHGVLKVEVRDRSVLDERNRVRRWNAPRLGGPSPPQTQTPSSKTEEAETPRG